MQKNMLHLIGHKKIEHAIELALVLVVLLLGSVGAAYSVKAYPKVFETQVSLENKGEIDPEEAVMLNFSDPMLVESVASAIEIFPETEINLQWQDNSRKLAIAPKGIWEPGKKYALKIREAKNFMLVDVSSELHFQVAVDPKIESFYPQDGAKDVLFDIEDPAAVIFDKSVVDYDLKFSVNPSEELSYQVSEDKKKVALIAKNGFQRGQEYKISLEIKYKKETAGKFRRILSTTFTTKPLPPKEWEKDFTARLVQAKKFTEAKIAAGKYIDVNLSAQIMTIFENGKLLDAYLISSGKRGMDTPKGEHKIYNKHPRAWSKKYGLYMPYWMAIVPSGFFGLHELPEWPSGYKEGQNHLGIPVSHGCVRLGVGPAQRVFEWAEIGTPVIIY